MSDSAALTSIREISLTLLAGISDCKIQGNDLMKDGAKHLLVVVSVLNKLSLPTDVSCQLVHFCGSFEARLVLR